MPKVSPSHAARTVVTAVRRAAQRYHRLVLVVGPPGAGKSAALAAVGERIAAPTVRVGLVLSQQMLALTEHQRRLQLRPLLEGQVATARGDVVLLDNIELLFETNLQQDPLRLLQGASRNKTVVAAWTGELRDGTLRYAAPGHPEHRHYPAGDLLIVTVETGDEAP